MLGFKASEWDQNVHKVNSVCCFWCQNSYASSSKKLEVLSQSLYADLNSNWFFILNEFQQDCTL